MTYLDIYTVGSSPDNDVDNKFNYRRILLLAVGIFIVVLSVLIFFIRKSDSTSVPPSELEPTPVPPSELEPTPVPPSELEPTPVPRPQFDISLPKTPISELNLVSPNIEPFTNDLPYQLNNESLTLSPDIDYNDFLQKMSLDQDVIQQHNQYVNDRNKITSTASFAPSRSDNQDIVTTWGLTKPNYVFVDPSARNVPSQDPEQGSKPVRLQWK